MAEAKVLGYRASDFNDTFFSAIATKMGMEFQSFVSYNKALEGNAGIASELDVCLSSGETITGIRKFTVIGKDRDGINKECDILVKIQSAAIGEEGLYKLIKPFGDDAYETAVRFGPEGMGVANRPHLEVSAAKCAMLYPALGKIRPEVYECVLDPARDRFLVASEFIAQEDREVGGLNTSKGWTHETRCQVLSALAQFHAHFMERTDEVERVFEGTLKRHPKRHLSGLPLMRVIDKAAQQEFPQIMNSERRGVIERYFDKLGEITEQLVAYPMTFVHNDAHAGNMFLRRNPSKEQSALALFDWETCCIHVPQRDVAVFLLYTLSTGKTPQETMQAWSECTEHYRMELISAISGRSEKLHQVFKDKELFTSIMAYMALETYVTRAALPSFFPIAMRNFDCEEGLLNILSYVEAISVAIPLLREP